jgi:hypothetical protein
MWPPPCRRRYGITAWITLSAKEVRVEFPPDLLLRRLFDRADEGVAGIVDDDIQAAEMGMGRRHGTSCLIGLRYIEHQWQHRASVLLPEIAEAFRIASGRDNLVAPLQRGFGPDAAEPPRGARDEPDFVCHVILECAQFRIIK